MPVFRATEVVVSGSGSRGAMFKKFYAELCEHQPEETEAKRLRAKTWEFSEFLVNQLGVRDLGAKFPNKVTFHNGCHGLRELRTREALRTLLRAV